MTDSNTAIDTLIGLMKSSTCPNPVRAGAAAGLGFAGGPAARTALIDIVKSTTAPLDLRAAAATALGHVTKV